MTRAKQRCHPRAARRASPIASASPRLRPLLATAIALAAFAGTVVPREAGAQAVPTEEAGARIERVEVVLANPSDDAALNARVVDLLRRSIRLFPTDRFSRSAAEIGLARARRQGPIASTTVSVQPGAGGALVVVVEATLSEAAGGGAPRGALHGRREDFPLLHDAGGTIVTGKLELLSMAYANHDAWYGRPDLLLAGNPLVDGRPAGEGTAAWLEGFLHAGVYGLTPLGGDVQAYAGLSVLGSASTGEELFTDRTRTYSAVEDAYVGLVGGDTSDAGRRRVWNVSVGRKRYAIGDGFLIANTASNGSGRAALQSNPRWAADLLVLAQLRVDTTLVEAFYLDPDELPLVDGDTRIAGVNLEVEPRPGLLLGATVLRVLDSDAGYFATLPGSPPGVALGRDGLEVGDLRIRWEAGPGGAFVNAEAALQRNRRFDMRAVALTNEAGYRWPTRTWRPEVSYRWARFSGDDPDTARFERWDPLLSGGNGEQWVQGINHFKVFQDSNLIAHRLQLRLRPSQRVELVPQLWRFRADTRANLGGNPALSFLDGRDLAWEANLTAKWFVSEHLMLQGHVAATRPSSGTRDAPGIATDLDPWLSAMLFVRLGY